MNDRDLNSSDGNEPFRLTRRSAIGVSALATAAVASSAFAHLSGNAQETADRSVMQLSFASPIASPVPDLDDALVDEIIAELASAGVAVFDRADDAAPLTAVVDPGPVSLLMSQLRPMVREAMLGGGVLGADIDALVTDRELLGSDGADSFELSDDFPEVDGTPYIPPSLLLASYIQTLDSPGAVLVRRFRPDIAGDQITTQHVPALGMILFAAEVAREHATTAGMTPAGVRALMPVAMQGGICSQVQGFIDNTINQLFSALTIDLGPSPLGQILGGIINGVIQGVRIPLRAAISALTKPVLDVIRDIAGVLGTVATVVSAIRPWTLQLTAAPVATRLAIGSEPGLPGEVTALVDLGGLDEWPADVADCAAQSGVPLPPLKPANARCTWMVTGSRPNLVQSDELPPALDANAKAVLKYHTLSEDEETAKGKPVYGWVMVTATVARPEVDDLKRTLSNLLFAQLPDILNQFVRPILGPIVDQLLGKIASLTDSQGKAMISVLYHEPKEPTPTPEPTEEAGRSIDFTIVPLEEVFPVSIRISASSCDGEAWTGNVSLSFHPDFNAVWADIEGRSGVDWDFAGGDQATATSGPFDATLEFWNGNAMALSYTFDLTITRTTDTENDEAETLSFDVIVHSTLDGDTESGQLTGGTNLGVPIPVVIGGAVCEG